VGQSWRFKSAVCICVSPNYNFPSFSTCDQSVFGFVACYSSHSCFVVTKLVVNGLCTLNGRENYFSVPVTAFDNMTALSDDRHREVEPLRTSIYLIHAVHMFIAIEFWLFVTTQRKRNRWVLVMSLRNPNKILDKAFFLGSDYPLIVNELREHYSFRWNKWLSWCNFLNCFLNWNRLKYL